jgi:glycine/D-amino acid oxidase-like deaminating enzyme
MSSPTMWTRQYRQSLQDPTAGSSVPDRRKRPISWQSAQRNARFLICPLHGHLASLTDWKRHHHVRIAARLWSQLEVRVYI